MSEALRIWKGVNLEKEKEWKTLVSQPSAGIDVDGSCPMCQSQTLHRYYDGIIPQEKGALGMVIELLLL